MAVTEKLYNLKAKNGTYTNKSGEQNPSYNNCGVVLKGEYGPYIMFDKTFNPAGIETEPGRSGIFISMFKDEEQSNASPTPPRSPQITPPPNVNFKDDDLSF